MNTSPLRFTSETVIDGVLERSFLLDDVPGVLWARPRPSAAGAPAPAELVLMGHGGGLHKRAPGLVARARTAVLRDGFVVASLDAPGHGDRPRSAEDQRRVDAMQRARANAQPIAGIVSEFNASLARRAVPEWQAALDALQVLPEVDADRPVGYSGMTLASEIGIRLAADDERIGAAVFGGVYASDELLAAARRVSVPVEVLLPWDDSELDRESGLAVFHAFASAYKTLQIVPGDHFRVPQELVDTRFFARHLRAELPVA